MLICTKTPGCDKLGGHDGACKRLTMTAPDVRTAAESRYGADRRRTRGDY